MRSTSTPSVNRRFAAIDGDLMALPILSISAVAPSNGCVYDFSVEADENFVAYAEYWPVQLALTVLTLGIFHLRGLYNLARGTAWFDEVLSIGAGTFYSVGVLFAVLINLRTADTSIGDTGHLTLVTRIHLVTLAFIVVLALVALRDRRRVEQGLQVRHPDWPTLAVVGSLYGLIIGGMILRAAWS